PPRGRQNVAPIHLAFYWRCAKMRDFTTRCERCSWRHKDSTGSGVGPGGCNGLKRKACFAVVAAGGPVRHSAGPAAMGLRKVMTTTVETVTVRRRQTRGTHANRRLRRQGEIPAVLY